LVGPAEATNATRRSPGLVVLKGGVVAVPRASRIAVCSTVIVPIVTSGFRTVTELPVICSRRSSSLLFLSLSIR